MHAQTGNGSGLKCPRIRGHSLESRPTDWWCSGLRADPNKVKL